MAGAGFAGAGFFAAGFGSVDGALAPSNAYLPDPRTGQSLQGRLLDPATGDYKFTADGRIYGQTQAQQLVQLACETIRGSAAVLTLGMDRSVLQERGRDLLATVQSMVQQAFDPIIAQGIVALNSVQVIDGPPMTDRAGILIQWTDLTTSEQHTQVI